MALVCETERLNIRHFQLSDANFIIELLNQESFIRHIGDKGVRSIADAEYYLKNGPLASYQLYGFGLNLVELKATGVPIGMCGILKRDELEVPDLGYAFMPDYCKQGLATEAAASVLERGMKEFQLTAVLAVTLPDNLGSNALLQRLGFQFTELIELYGSDNNLYRYTQG